MEAFNQWLIKAIVVPAGIELIKWFFSRRRADPEFKAASDELFRKLGAAETDEEFSESAKDLQKLIRG